MARTRDTDRSSRPTLAIRLSHAGLSTTRLCLIAAGFITLYFGSTIFGNRVHQYRLDEENARLEQQIADGQGKYARLQALRDWMQGDAYLATMAREQGMVLPGDHQIVVAAPTAAAPSSVSADWWDRYFEP